MKEKNQANYYQPQHQPKVLHHIMDNNTYFPIKLSDSQSYIKQDVSKKGCLCVISESILAYIEDIYRCHIPLTVSNDIPGSDIQLGTSDDDKVFLLVFCDS